MVEHVGEGLDQLQKNRIAIQSITSAEENRKANLWQITLSSTFKEGLGLLQLGLKMGKRVDLLTIWNAYLVWGGGLLQHSHELGDRVGVHGDQAIFQ